MGLVFEADLNVFGNLSGEICEILTSIVVDIGIQCHLYQINDAVDDAQTASFQPLFHRQQNLASEHIG